MIIDVAGVELTPGNGGKDCIGNGEHFDSKGNPIEMCCEECDYFTCCISYKTDCKQCNDLNCPVKYRVYLF